MRNSDLWSRIQQVDLNDPTSHLKITERLASENGWKQEYASRVVEEYKRFMYLAIVCSHAVTPSDQVDQMWHLHMIYTRDYDSFCEDVLGKWIHHGPTKGGKAQDDLFEKQYRETKESYLEEFGQAVPEDIWPPASVRFATPFMRVNLREFTVTRNGQFLIVRKSEHPLITSITTTLIKISKACQRLGL